MESIINILSSIEFWKIVAPALVAIAAWCLNERSKRKWEEYKRKEESYKELLRTLRGFYVKEHDAELKNAFLHQLNLCWLYTPDEVIKRAYSFLEKVHTNISSTDEEKELAVGKLVESIRNDLLSRNIVKKTNLKAKDFKHLVST